MKLLKKKLIGIIGWLFIFSLTLAVGVVIISSNSGNLSIYAQDLLNTLAIPFNIWLFIKHVYLLLVYGIVNIVGVTCIVFSLVFGYMVIKEYILQKDKENNNDNKNEEYTEV